MPMHSSGFECSCIKCSSSVLLPVLNGEGASSPAFDTNCHDANDLTVDFEAFKRGQEFVYCNFFSVFVGHLVGLVSLLNLEPILKVLIMTGVSDTPEKSFQRYFRTILALKNWYETDIWKKDMSGYKSLQEVRRKHNQSKCMAETVLSHRITQRDMVLTQWAFVAPVVIQSHKLGVKESSWDQLQDFVYFWKIIGTLLGLQERFNLCQGSFSDVQKECSAILHQIIEPAMKLHTKRKQYMITALVDGLVKLMPMMESNSFVNYTSYVLEVPVQNKINKWQFTWNVWILERGFHIPLLGILLRFTLNFLLVLAIFLKRNYYKYKDLQRRLDRKLKNFLTS